MFREIHKVLLALSCMNLPNDVEITVSEYNDFVNIKFYIEDDTIEPVNVSMNKKFINKSRPSRLVQGMSDRIQPLTKKNKGGIVVVEEK